MDSSAKPRPSAIMVMMTEREEQYFKPLLNNLLERDTTRDFRHGWAKESGGFAVLHMGRDEGLKLLDRFDAVWPDPGDSEFIDDMRRRFHAQLGGPPDTRGRDAPPPQGHDGMASGRQVRPETEVASPVRPTMKGGWIASATEEGSPREVVQNLPEAFAWYMATVGRHLVALEGTDPQLSMFGPFVWDATPQLIRVRAATVSDGFLLAFHEGHLMGAPEPVRSQAMPRRRALHSALVIGWAVELTRDIGDCGVTDLLNGLAGRMGLESVPQWWATMIDMPTEFTINLLRRWKDDAWGAHRLHR